MVLSAGDLQNLELDQTAGGLYVHDVANVSADQRTADGRFIGNPQLGGIGFGCADQLIGIFGATAVALGGVALSVVIAARN